MHPVHAVKRYPPARHGDALGVRCCHSLEFGQDRHFLKVLGAEARPIDTRRCGGTKTVMPRRSAWARSGRCGESGLTLMTVALFHGSMSRSRAAAISAPAKFGIRPCGGNGKRATPSALSLSHTHCRAALLSAKSRAMTESGAARPGDSQGRNLFYENLGKSSPRRGCTRRSRSPMLDGQGEPPRYRNPGGVAAEESGRRLPQAVLERYGGDQTGCGGLSVVEQPASH